MKADKNQKFVFCEDHIWEIRYQHDRTTVYVWPEKHVGRGPIMVGGSGRADFEDPRGLLDAILDHYRKEGMELP